MIIALYIDDIILFRQDKKKIDIVKKKLKEFHLIIDSSHINKLLGIHFTWEDNRSTYLD